METIELINGSWVQTFTKILYDINTKLNDDEINLIIKRIDERFVNDITSLQVDNTFIKNNVVSILNRLNDFEKLKLDNNYIKDEIKLVLNRLNSLSIIKEVKVIKPVLVEKERKHFHRERQQIQEVKCQVEEKVYVMDMFLKSGHSEGYRIDVSPGAYTHDWRLSWLISGDKRRLLHCVELTDDILEIYKKYGITDIEIIKKSRLSTYKSK